MTIAREHSACVRVSVSVLISVGRIWPWRTRRPEQVFGSACGERLTAVYVQDVYSKLTLLRPGWSPYGNEMDTRARRKSTQEQAPEHQHAKKQFKKRERESEREKE